MTNIKYVGTGEEYPPVPVQGSITIDHSLFPQEILQKMLQYPYQMPYLNLRIPVVILTDGLVMESGSEGTRYTFDFVAENIEVVES